MSAPRIAAAITFAAVLVVPACRRAAKPDPTPYFDQRARFTCCTLHHESGEVSDANYWVGDALPAGTPVKIESVKPHSVVIVAGETKLTLKHEYGTKQESFEQYLNKVLVPYDPRRRIGEFPKEVQRAIANGKVERGMTREQVVLSLGHPPMHRTRSLDELEWTYWYNHWVTYKVLFNDRGKVAGVIGRPAPTAEVAIENSDPVPPDKKKGGKGSAKRKKKS